jgi:uncharacterized membrane protein YsdA (DUF1294 family)
VLLGTTSAAPWPVRVASGKSDLLSLALIGGSSGALLARHLLRHKTRKVPFSTQLLVIVVLQIEAIIGFVLT